VDGCPPGISITEAEIQHWLDKRKPGQSRFTTQRREPDAVRILSGVMPREGGGFLTTGTPIALQIENVDQRSKDYSAIKHQYRPGHADFTYDAKYGIRDYRGSGRASARETASRVAAGGIARKITPDVVIRGALVRIGKHAIDRDHWDWSAIDSNPFFSPDPGIVPIWEEYLDQIRKDGSSVGAEIEVVAGVEIGAGFAAARLTGEENADEIRMGDDGPLFLSNNAGGILGGISTGQPLVARFAVKPTSSILKPRKSIDDAGHEVDVSTKGRHDPCVGIRAVPIGEAMIACVLADHYLRHRGQMGTEPGLS
jgi:chorismate synthase